MAKWESVSLHGKVVRFVGAEAMRMLFPWSESAKRGIGVGLEVEDHNVLSVRQVGRRVPDG